MSVSVLGLKVFGSGVAGVFRVVNSVTTLLGETFGVVTLTGAPVGVFQAGETLTFGGGGTAVLTEAAKTGPHRLILASLSGGISGSVTGGTSGATATVSAGEFLETAPSTDFNGVSARVVQFRGAVYAFHYNTIYRLDETLGVSGGRWVEAHRLTVAFANANDARYKTGLFILVKNGSPIVAALWSPTSGGVIRRVISSDGYAWAELQVAGSGGISSTTLTKALVFNNVLFVWTYVAGTSNVLSWDPSTDGVGVSAPAIGTFLGYNCNVMVVARNRLFYFSIQNGTGLQRAHELVGGTWVLAMSSATGSNNVVDRPIGWVGNEGNIYTIQSGGSSGYYLLKWNLDTMMVSDISNPVLPLSLRNGQGVSVTGAWDVYADMETDSILGDNANATFYLWFSAAQNAGGLASSYRFEGEATPMTPLGTGGPAREIALPYLVQGGGQRTFATGDLGVDFLNVQSIIGGERWRFYLFKRAGDPDVTDVKIRALYRLATSGDKGGLPTLWGYVQNPSVGSVSPGNREIVGLTADSVPGTLGTLYTVDVLLVSQDGVANFSLLRRALVAYV